MGYCVHSLASKPTDWHCILTYGLERKTGTKSDAEAFFENDGRLLGIEFIFQRPNGATKYEGLHMVEMFQLPHPGDMLDFVIFGDGMEDNNRYRIVANVECFDPACPVDFHTFVKEQDI